MADRFSELRDLKRESPQGVRYDHPLPCVCARARLSARMCERVSLSNTLGCFFNDLGHILKSIGHPTATLVGSIGHPTTTLALN